MQRALVSVVLTLLGHVSAARALPASQSPPIAACDDTVRGHERLQSVLAFMRALPTAPAAVWPGYRPDEASYVFFVPGADQKACGVLWRKDSGATTFEMAASPRLQTPIYGFLFPPDAKQDMAGAGDQPDALRRQLESMGVLYAVIAAVEGNVGLPQPLSSQSVFDIAVHEAFHAFVQFPTWAGFASTHRWPQWSTPPPDRAALAASCYGSTNPRGQRLTAEREHLVLAATSALTDSSTSALCTSTRAFIAERRRRWSELASAPVSLERSSGSLSCPQAESIMELNEGVPDFVSWLTARALRVVDDARLSMRFNAMQRDAFYLTGMMQMVVLHRLLGGEFPDLVEQLISAPAWEQGAIFPRLDSEVAARCR